MEQTFYLELYLYDYLKQNNYRMEAELWGTSGPHAFYICALQDHQDRRTMRAKGLEYFGQFKALSYDENLGKYLLHYEQAGVLKIQPVVVYIASETEEMDEFVLEHMDNMKQKAFQDCSEAADLLPEAKTSRLNLSLPGKLFQILACIILILLQLNMIVSLNSYEGMKEILKVTVLTLLFAD